MYSLIVHTVHKLLFLFLFEAIAVFLYPTENFIAIETSFLYKQVPRGYIRCDYFIVTHYIIDYDVI